MQPNADTIKYVREKAQRRNCIIEFYSISTRPGLSACIFIERHLLSTLFMTVHFYEPINGRDIQPFFCFLQFYVEILETVIDSLS